MYTVKIGNPINRTKIELYDSIDELTIEAYSEFNYLVLKDLHIGSDMESVSKHFLNLFHYLKNQKTAEATQETKNLYMNYFYQIEKINVKSYCFMALVHKINGEVFTDFSDDNLEKKIKWLSKKGLKDQHVTKTVNEIKKKLLMNLEPTFLLDTGTVGLTLSMMKLLERQN